MPASHKTRREDSEPTPIVTFYSYKGGVGRSMAVLNVASLIASRGFRVLIIDFDLEAPGLSHLLGKEAIPAKKQPGRKTDAAAVLKDGVVELLSDAVLRGSESDLLSKPFSQIAGKYTFAYKPPLGLKQHAGGHLYIMPSGRLDEGYSARLDLLDLPGLYRESENSGKRLILRFREILTHSGLYDYILVDSRTGHSDEAGICTRDLADHRMVVSGLNTQNIAGTAAFLHNLRAALTQENKPLKTPDIILSPVPNGEDDMVAVREKVAREEFQKAWHSRLEINLLIPYHPRLALTEEAYVPAITASPLRSAYLEIEGRLLRSLGHVPRVLDDAFRKTVIRGDGSTALNVFRQLTRLLHAPQFPGQIASLTGFQFHLGYEEDLLRQILRLDEALDILMLYAENTFVRFDVTTVAKKIHDFGPALAAEFDGFLLTLDHLHPNEIGSYANFLTNTRKDHDAAGVFYKRAIDADPKHAHNLGNYAIFLTDIRKDYNAAEVFYKRAIDADPKHANNLCNYAHFLTNIRKDYDAAAAFYKRAIDANPKDADTLCNYAFFLTDIRKDHDAAEKYYRRAIDAEPTNVNTLCNYAFFLTDIRKDHDATEKFYRRAIDAEPTNVNTLCNYAFFLTDIRKDHAAAEKFYRRAIDAEPTNANILGKYAYILTCFRKDPVAAESFFKRAVEADPTNATTLNNFGHFLIGLGRAPEGLGLLRSAWVNLDKTEVEYSAAFAYSLWVGTTIIGAGEDSWERIFKHLIAKGFPRSEWSFDSILSEAEKKLQPADFKYAKALAVAFLDKFKVPELEKFPRWKKIQPLDPALVDADGTIRKAKKA